MVAYKSLARAISDIAALGGEPRCFLLSLALPEARIGAWLQKFLLALRAAARTMQCPLAGGDTTRRNEILINITVVGECQRGRAILRTGARPGDAIFVTGTLGEAEYGLQLARNSSGPVNSRDARVRKHLFPEPRLAAGQWLAKHRFATAMMDLSDGLSTDLPKLCQANRVGARIIQRNLPSVTIPENRRAPKFVPAELALHGGDDYELLFTVARKNVKRIPRKIGRVRVTRIGEITSGKQITLVRESGAIEKLKSKGWDPFR
jgi:thiamine-monophosphate kinase